MKTIRLKEGKERSLLRRHPWIFESAIAKGGADAGETVRVESHEGDFLAWAAFSPASKIRARAWSFDETQRIDAAFLIAACTSSVKARDRFDIQSDGLRLIHGESDGLPGLIVDRYGDTLVAQFLSSGAEHWKDVLADALLAATGLSKLYERSDASSRAQEGLPEVKGWLRGDGPTDLVLPGLTLGLFGVPYYAAVVAESTRAALSASFTRTAVAKGLPRRLIIRRHVLRTCISPVITLIGLDMALYISGVVFVETVFAYPGIGSLQEQSFTEFDRPVLMGTVIVGAVVVISFNLLADVVRALLDPRTQVQDAG